MQDAIVDTTGAYAAGQDYIGPRLGFNGVEHLREPAAIPCGVRPVLVGLGRGWAAFGPPLFAVRRRSTAARMSAAL
jgi:hypothetical protein